MTSNSPPPASEKRSLAPLFISLFIAAFGFLPIANWIPGGHRAPWYHMVASLWASGCGLVIGVGVVLAILSRQLPLLWRAGVLDQAVLAWRDHPRRTAIAIAACAFMAYLAVATLVFGRHPLFIDEITQLLQAQIFAGGRLWRPAGPHAEFFGSMLVANADGRTFAQFPSGGPAMLLPGMLVGAPWLSDPLWGAIAVLAFAAFVRVAEPRPGVALCATIVLAFAPFTMFMSGSHMNHVPAFMWIAISMAALVRVMRSGRARPGLALLNGFAYGCAATIRPVDALAFALPAAAWYLVRAWRNRARWADALAAGAGVAVPLALLFWINSRTTGSPFLFGYELLWGKSHALGFHAAPWGLVHTPARGVELINIYFLQLQTYLFESPLPSLLPAIAAFALARTLSSIDRYLIASSAALLALYFAYWHEGFYLGPRFMYVLLPLLALYTARLFPLVRDRFGTGLPYRTVIWSAISAALIAATTLVPLRARAYRNALVTMQWDANGAARAAHVENALVLVRTSWGAQLLARLWALGVPRSEAELIYRSVDACALESRLDSLDTGLASSTDAEGFRSMLGDSSRLVRSPLSPDSSERLRPGVPYTPRCLAHIREDREGFTLFTPLLVAHGGGNIYAHDLGARDSLLLRAYPARPVYLLRPASTRVGDPPRFYPLRRDSLARAWTEVAPIGTSRTAVPDPVPAPAPASTSACHSCRKP